MTSETKLTTLTALSPIDGRYFTKTHALSDYCSEFALIKYRVWVEIRWFIALSKQTEITELPPLAATEQAYLEEICHKFNLTDAEQIKTIERTTNHDVKAVEYFLKEKFDANAQLQPYKEFIHFACTSADINNLAYGLMLKTAYDDIIIPMLKQLVDETQALAKQYAGQAMLARTHGQSATPTTMGKEMANFVKRFQRQLTALNQVQLLGKINGATGSYNAHHVTYPEVNWPQFSQQFVESLGLTWNAYTAQIEQHDAIAELFDALTRFNNILVDFDRDIWGYISLGYFKQKTIAGEVGSSTMPHKVNPIDFENSEGNALFANAVMKFLSGELTTSRWQRDLVDSTLLRNVGVGLAHSMISYQSVLKGIGKLEINPERLNADLNQNWGVLAEAIQMVMRRYGIDEPYEKLKSLTRGKTIDQAAIQNFIATLELPTEVKQGLAALTPDSYIGLAKQLAEKV